MVAKTRETTERKAGTTRNPAARKTVRGRSQTKIFQIRVTVKTGPFETLAEAKRAGGKIKKANNAVSNYRKLSAGYFFDLSKGWKAPNARIKNMIVSRLNAHIKKSGISASRIKATVR